MANTLKLASKYTYQEIRDTMAKIIEEGKAQCVLRHKNGAKQIKTAADVRLMDKSTFDKHTFYSVN
jgi:hypothetical protein